MARERLLMEECDALAAVNQGIKNEIRRADSHHFDMVGMVISHVSLPVVRTIEDGSAVFTFVILCVLHHKSINYG